MKPAAVAALTGSSPTVAEKSHAPRVITVGAGGEVTTIAQAAKLARDGDTVEVQAGEYRGDVAVWTQKRLTLRAVGGRAALVADGRSVEGKGIWVMRGGEFTVEGFDFMGARVGQRNGAGIRFERGSLVVRDARFIDNENGILTSNDRESTLVVERSLFSGNGYGDGQSHGLYAGAIDRLEVRGSYFRNGKVGHLLKTRARENRIEYNRLTDEAGNSSYELEFPVGGQAVVIGNIIEQSPNSSNSTIISWGAEGFRWPVNELTLSHNTVINRRPQGSIFLRVRTEQPTRVVLLGNVWAGDGTFVMGPVARREGDIELGLSALPGLKDHDYSLSVAARARFGMRGGSSADEMRPTKQYVHERSIRSLTTSTLVPGAVQ